MKLRWTLILFGLNALLLWVVIGQAVDSPSKRAFESQVRTFLPLGKTDWDGMGVSTPTERWRVSRDRWGHWWLKSPSEWPAQASLASRMNGYLSTLPVDSVFAVKELGRVGQSLRSYGLDNPRAVLEVSSGAKTLSYKIGNTTPLGNRVYVLSADEKEVWVVDAGINEYLSYTAQMLRQEGFFPFSLAELEAVEVEQKGATTAFERKKGTNQWQLKVGEKLLALKSGTWEDWLQKLSGTNVANASMLDTAQQVLNTPSARISFQTLYGRRTLLVGELSKNGARRWVQWEGSQEAFLIPADSLAALQPDRLLEDKPLPVLPKDIVALDWTVGVDKLSLRKLEGGQWVIASDNNAAADPSAVEEVLQALCSTEASPKIKTETTLEKTAAEQLRLQAAGQTIELTIVRSKNGTAEITGAEGRVTYSCPRWPASPAVAALVDRRIFTEAAPQLQSVLMKKMSDGSEKRYEAETPQGQALAAILKNTPRAQRWLTQAPTEAASWRMEVVTQAQTVTLELWKTPEGWVGGTGGRWFVAEDALARWIETLISL